jgi:hypothetical protein
LVAALQAALTQREELEGTSELVKARAGRLPPLAELASAGPQLRSCAFRLKPADWPTELPAGALVQRVDAGADCFLVAVGLKVEISALEVLCRAPGAPHRAAL